MPYAAGKYRVASDAASTTIVGADYGALFSIYASLMRPDLFGNCVAMSPMLWINDGAFAPLVSKASSSQSYYISAGSAEPQWLIDGARALSESLNATAADACYTEFAGATHTDDAWGASFGSILSAINSDEMSVSGKSLVRNYAAYLETEVYTLYGGTDKNIYNPAATDRDPEAMGMLAIPGIELSKDSRNNWSEKTGGEFNHHNDFFTGRKGQEFMS
ncbi:MAG: hypothetical protein K2L73_05770 [Muribaculaceae bacterium]|nr:hypothetical protein [Muribaculaceae bacterium]